MPKNWPNGLVYQTEYDIVVRDMFITLISAQLREAMQQLNPSICFTRVETPVLVPGDIVASHVDAKFPLWKAASSDDALFLRPESTNGTYEMFHVLFPQKPQLAKRLPLCLWQVGLSFRVEQDKSFKHLRFKQFYQMEFQLAYAEGTKADYHSHAVAAMQKILARYFPACDVHPVDMRDCPEEMPFYSLKTTDLYLDDWEVVAISDRTDFDHPVLEISCGLDRLVAIFEHAVDD